MSLMFIRIAVAVLAASLVSCAASTWTQSHSTDGTSWTPVGSFDYALTVTGVGLYGGNAVGDTELNILTTHVIGTGTIVRDPDLPAYGCGDVVQLTANPSAGWIFDSWSGDLTGSANPTTVTMEGPSIKQTRRMLLIK